jgi:hypothetical protein
VHSSVGNCPKTLRELSPFCVDSAVLLPCSLPAQKQLFEWYSASYYPWLNPGGHLKAQLLIFLKILLVTISLTAGYFLYRAIEMLRSPGPQRKEPDPEPLENALGQLSTQSGGTIYRNMTTLAS